MRIVNKKHEPKIDIKTIPVRVERFQNSSIPQKIVDEFRKLEKFLETAGDADPVIIMKKLYRFIDNLMTDSVYRHAACAKGCAHCCKVPLTVTVIEAAYIEYMTRKTLKVKVSEPKELKTIRESVDDYCPLLDQETATCSVYEYRPMNCRTFATIDHWSICEDASKSHWIYTHESNAMFKHIRKFLDRTHASNSDCGSPDIRDWIVKDDA